MAHIAELRSSCELPRHAATNWRAITNNFNAGKITATFSHANQIIEMRSIDQWEQTSITEENTRPSVPLVDPNRRSYTVATAAQIEANQNNAKRSTGPTVLVARPGARMNSLKHGMAARTIMPVLPQEDPKLLEECIQE